MSQNLANSKIKHVFVLMLENRSYDHMLGFLNYTGTDSKTGGDRTPNGSNRSMANTYSLGASYHVDNTADDIMKVDPGHEFEDVLQQLTGSTLPYNNGPYPAINNSGFVDNFASHCTRCKPPYAGVGDIMLGYDTAKNLPVLATLAQEFALCDNWFSSVPGPTWPNRLFVHAASSGGLDYSPNIAEIFDRLYIKGYHFPNGTIYDLLDKTFKGEKNWRLYRGRAKPKTGSIPVVAALKGISISHTEKFEDFREHLKKDYHYKYTFIEPNYGRLMKGCTRGQSQHPNDDVQNGEELIRFVYEAIRKSDLWLSSMLIITYDEHGGFYDHVPPPRVTPPADTRPHEGYNKNGFDFSQLGVRVPAVVVSAYTKKGWISNDVYDHSSIPATLEAIFNMAPLTKRDAAANNLTGLCSLGNAREDTPVDLDGIQIPAFYGDLEDEDLSQDEADSSADQGNLPGFLHVVIKSRLEEDEMEGLNMVARNFPDELAVLQKNLNEKGEVALTKGQLKEFLDKTLPGLLGSNSPEQEK